MQQTYELLYDEKFEYNNLSNQFKLQKGIYLLSKLGVPSNYGFSFYKHGPYSQELYDDTMNLTQEEPIKFKADVMCAIRATKRALKPPIEATYTLENWLECLCFLCYIREDYCAFNTSEKNILSELTKRKPNLADNKTNKIALSRIKNIFK